MKKEKENKIYDTEFFRKSGAKGGHQVAKNKKISDPDFHKRNGLKAAEVRWGFKPKPRNNGLI